MSKRARLLRAFILLCTLAFMTYFALFERFFPLEVPEAIRGHGDHNLHMLAFFCLTVILLPGFRSVIGPLLFAVFVALALEVLQIWLPDRGANLDDLLASLGGIALGFVMVFAIRSVFQRFQQSLR